MVNADLRHISTLKGDRGAPGQKGDTGTFAQVAAHAIPADQQARAVASGPQDARRLDLYVPRGLSGSGALATDEAVAEYLASRDSESGSTLTRRIGGRVSVLEFGAVGDGVTNDLPAFQAAITAAGPGGTVYVPNLNNTPQTVYVLAGARPDLSGSNILSDPGVTLRVDANPNVKDWGLLSPVTIDNPVHQTILRKAAGTDIQRAVGMAAGDFRPLSITPIDLTTLDARATDGSGLDPVGWGAFSGVVEENRASWPDNFEVGLQGVFLTPEIGVLYEACVESTSPGTSAQMWLGGVVLNQMRTWYMSMQMSPNVSAAAFSGSPGFGEARTITIPATHRLPAASGGVIVGLRLRSRRVIEWYLNKKLVWAQAFNDDIGQVGWGGNAFAANFKVVHNAVSYNRDWNPKGNRQVQASLIGSSTMYGAWEATGVADFLPIAFHGLPGGGAMRVRENYGVSGTSIADWASGGAYDIQQYDFTSDDYVCILLGTNDIQGGQWDITVLLAQMQYIVNKIIADGARPVIGVPQLWWPEFITGVPGVSTSNVSRGAAMRAGLTRWAAERLYPIALVDDEYGEAYWWAVDNIHSDDQGQSAIARAFAQAIARDFKPATDPAATLDWSPWISVSSSWYRNGWSPYTGSTVEYRRHSRTGVMQVRGRIWGGTAPQAIVFPQRLGADVPTSTAVRTVTNGTPGVGVVSADTSGLVSVNTGSTGSTGTTFTELGPLQWETVLRRSP